MVFSFLKGKCARPKNRARLKSFARPSAPDLHWVRNLFMPDFVEIQYAFCSFIQNVLEAFNFNRNILAYQHLILKHLHMRKS